MKATINISEELFRYLFVLANRENNFTHEGLGILYQHLSALEEESKPQELNVVNFCMEYSEETLKDFCFRHALPTSYSEPIDVDEDGETISISHSINNDELKECVLDYMNYSTKYYLIGFTDDSVLYSTNF